MNADTWAILHAADEGDIDTVRRMIADDPDLLTANCVYWQSLHFASRGGHADLVKMLLNTGADPLSHIWSHGYKNPLEAARDSGHEDSV